MALKRFLYSLFCGSILVLSSLVVSFPVVARDAAFITPRNAASGDAQEAIKVEPSSDIILGETTVNVGRRTTAFFVNLSSEPVEIVSITSNGDANVLAEIVADDCTKQGKIAVGSRCSVSVELTPLSYGSWTAELMLTHKGAGRLARVAISGRTGGASSSEKKEMGLELSSQNIAPVDFGTVEVGPDRSVRTALMVNDSNDNIKVLSIEVIAPENGLTRFEQGCRLEEELEPAESCPVTLVWKPEAKGVISTDLIIRHSGKRGFTVIPIRGVANSTKGNASSASNTDGQAYKAPQTPTRDELEGMLSGDVIASKNHQGTAPSVSFVQTNDILDDLHLIGTVGDRAVFHLNGKTFVTGLGGIIKDQENTVKLMDIMAKEVRVLSKGKIRYLPLETASALVNKVNKKNQEASSVAAVPEPAGQ